MNKHLLSLGGVALALVLFVAVNMVASAALAPARLDLTENSLYTLSKGSRAIAAKVKEPISLTLYYSDALAAELSPQIQSYGTRVKEVLREYAGASKGKISLSILSPDPFSDTEDRAVQAGLAGIPVGRTGEQRFYFGLVASNSTDRTETIPFFRPDREEFLEYELTRLIYLLSDPPKKSVGIVSWLPIEGAPANPMSRQPAQPWQIYTQLRELFSVKPIPPTATEIPADIQVLLVVHPKNPSESLQYAIDQFVLKGGRAIVFLDPLCEADVPPGMNPMQAMQVPKASSMPRLLDAWGLQMTDAMFAADRSAALRVRIGSESNPEPIDYVAWLNLKGAALDSSDPITGQLTSLNLATAGILSRKDGATTTFVPLLHTSADSMPVATSAIQFMPDPKKLLADFKPGGQPLTIAARISGKAKSAFPSAPTPPAPPADPNNPEAPAPAAPSGPHVAESLQDISVVVVADCDMLSDQLWVREERIGNLVLGLTKLADNGDFVIGAADNLSGSSDLMSVRARGKFARPFDKVQQIQRDAEQRFREKEQQLESKLQATEQKINQLQRQRPDQAAQSGGGVVLLTPEQQAEIENFRKEQVDTRKQLRDVRHQLSKDIERLGTAVKFLNIGLMPLLVGLAAIALSAWRVNRRRHDRWTPTALS
jgi:ABC-type uncharacterized transport system involved in gliding motility auxiliary subunit